MTLWRTATGTRLMCEHNQAQPVQGMRRFEHLPPSALSPPENMRRQRHTLHGGGNAFRRGYALAPVLSGAARQHRPPCRIEIVSTSNASNRGRGLPTGVDELPHTKEASFVAKRYAYQTTLVATASVTTDHGAGRLGPEERRRFGRCAQTACTRYTLERFIHTRLHRPGRVCSLLAPGAMQKALARMQPPAAHRPRETCGRNSRAASTNRVVAKINAAERVVKQGIAYTWSARLVALTRQPTTHRPPRRPQQIPIMRYTHRMHSPDTSIIHLQRVMQSAHRAW